LTFVNAYYKVNEKGAKDKTCIAKEFIIISDKNNNKVDIFLDSIYPQAK
jgi:hypothetical protein